MGVSGGSSSREKASERAGEKERTKLIRATVLVFWDSVKRLLSSSRMGAVGVCVELSIVSLSTSLHLAWIMSQAGEGMTDWLTGVQRQRQRQRQRQHLISLDIVRVGFLMLPYAQPPPRARGLANCKKHRECRVPNWKAAHNNNNTCNNKNNNNTSKRPQDRLKSLDSKWIATGSNSCTIKQHIASVQYAKKGSGIWPGASVMQQRRNRVIKCDRKCDTNLSDK